MFISSGSPQHLEEAVPRCVYARLDAPGLVSSYGGLQLVMGVPQARWMVYFMENPINMVNSTFMMGFNGIVIICYNQ